MSFALRLLNSTQVIETDKEVDNAIKTNLKGIFISLDNDNDGFLNRSQLIQAMNCIGLLPREPLIKKYFDACRNRDMLNDTSGNTVGNNRRQSVKVSGRVVANPTTTKIDMVSFVTVTIGEMDKLKLAEKELDPLFQFEIEGSDNSKLNVQNLKHLLVDTLSATSLDASEFSIFINALGIKQEGDISVSELKKKMLLLAI